MKTIVCLAALSVAATAQVSPNIIDRIPAARARAAGSESPKPEAIQLTGYEWVIPELILGGEWTSTIRLTNRGSQPTPATNVYFVDNNGRPMSATFETTSGAIVTDVAFSFTLGVGGMVEATFIGGSSTQFGQAIIGCSANGCGTAGLYGEVTLTNHNSTRPDFQSVFPIEFPAAFQYMLFDGRNGLTTTLYVDNESTSATNVAMDIRDTNNNLLGTVNIPLPAIGAQIFTLHVVAPETIGIQGTLVFRSPSSSVLITATGLRVNPTNSFTPIRAFIP